jgi:acyl-coenzyme A thioesterase PaaI-like protein
MSNIINQKLGKIRKILPRCLHSWAINQLFGRFVPFLNTAGIQFEEVSPQRVMVSIKNKRKVQNHIKGVHATAMALLGETATGFAVVLNLPEGKLPLLKSMNISYKKRSKGHMKAIAHLTPEQCNHMQTLDKGELIVPVQVFDESGEEPIQCEFVWAWVSRKS